MVNAIKLGGKSDKRITHWIASLKGWDCSGRRKGEDGDYIGSRLSEEVLKANIREGDSGRKKVTVSQSLVVFVRGK